ncbi:MAG: SusC/RagA family TonB-linked outer membrane protein [Pseudarcicella sp.]|nr:SusC/RagA family TonB-linked outer membrane protein [Pseudarcicella sp.]
MNIQKLIPWKGIILLSLMLTNTLFIFAQERKINGRVTDAQGDPVPGVSVVQKGTTSGSTTNEAGEYNLLLKPASDVLIFSAVGFGKQEAKIGNRTEINVKLDIDQKSLDEVVVLGYGSKKKSLVTGSISSISAKDFEKQALTTVDQALQGRTTGVQMFSSSGAPGSASKIRIRGAGSNGKTEPLYIVDGMKAMNIDNISPADIANIEVLKDAASTAIYGTDGGNGIIVVTTKSGKFNAKPSATYSVQMGSQSLRTNMRLMNSTQFKTYQDAARRYTPANPEKGIFEGYWEGGVDVKPNGINTNWLDEVFQSAPMATHNLSFSGGGPMTSYLLSGSFTNQDGILGGEQANFKRYTVRLNTKSKVANWLEVGNNISYTNIGRNSITEDDEYRGYVTSAISMDPLTPTHYQNNILPSGIVEAFKNNNRSLSLIPKDDNGMYYALPEYASGEITNPLALLAITKGGSGEDRILGNVFVNIMPMKNLTITSRFGVDYRSSLKHTWNPTYFLANEVNNSLTTVRDEYETSKTWLFENFATYSAKFNKNDLTAVIGYTAEKYNRKDLSLSSSGMRVENDKYAYHNYTSRAGDAVGGDFAENSSIGTFGRVTYGYDNQYLLEGSVRYDVFSLFPPGNKGAFFPSFSAGWVASNNDMFKGGVFDYLKFKFSWGANGSRSNLVSREDLQFWKGATDGSAIGYPSEDESVILPGVNQDKVPNPSLKWETSLQTDFGVELRALNNRLNFGVNYFNKNTNDLLLSGDATKPKSSGVLVGFENAGSINNKGFEFELGYNNTKNDFTYGVNLNLTTLNNKVTQAGPNSAAGFEGAKSTNRVVTRFMYNQPVWSFVGYKTNGIDPATGAVKYVDINNDGEISDADITTIGKPNPDMIFGGQLKLGYKNVDFNINFQGTQGNDINMKWFRLDRIGTNKLAEFEEKGWKKPGDMATYPKATNDDGKYYFSDLMVGDGSYFRIQQIQLGYTLPKSILKSLHVSNIRLYTSVEDYFTFTKYLGLDPAVSGKENNSQGIDRGSYPTPGKIMFGLSVNL